MADLETGIRDGKRTWVAPVEWFPRPDGLERAMVFQPGYSSAPNANPAKDYGVHGMELRWLLRGPKGGATFTMYTDWIPGRIAPGHGMSPDGSCSHVRRSLVTGEWEQYYPMGADLSRHALVPQFDGEEEAYGARENCEVTRGICWSDGTSLGASELARQFVVHGEPAIWAKLEDWYQDLKVASDG